MFRPVFLLFSRCSCPVSHLIVRPAGSRPIHDVKERTAGRWPAMLYPIRLLFKPVGRGSAGSAPPPLAGEAQRHPQEDRGPKRYVALSLVEPVPDVAASVASPRDAVEFTAEVGHAPSERADDPPRPLFGHTE